MRGRSWFLAVSVTSIAALGLLGAASGAPSVTSAVFEKQNARADAAIAVQSTYWLEMPDTFLALLPQHACDNASDCREAVDETCNENNAGGVKSNSSVTVEWNEDAGTGSCQGSCANGGSVTLHCTRRS
jgi:hypothetical protein